MTSTKVVDLQQWRTDHPPMMRLAAISLHCWQAYWRMLFAAQSAAISSVARILR